MRDRYVINAADSNVGREVQNGCNDLESWNFCLTYFIRIYRISEMATNLILTAADSSFAKWLYYRIPHCIPLQAPDKHEQRVWFSAVHWTIKSTHLLKDSLEMQVWFTEPQWALTFSIISATFFSVTNQTTTVDADIRQWKTVASSTQM